MAKRQRVIKEPVRIRFKELSNGAKSIYLDIYYDEKRSYEFLKLYLKPETSRKAAMENKETMRLAETIRAQRVIDVTEGKIGIFDTSRKSKTLLKDWLDHVHEEKLKNGQSGSNALTINNLNMHLIKFRGEKIRLCDVDRNFLIGFIEYLADADSVGIIKKKISRSTAHLYFNTFNTVLNEAVREGRIQSNPIQQLKREEKKPVRSKESNRVYLTLEEVDAMSKTHCENRMVKRAFMFSCFCGLRISDVESLTWDDIKKDGDHYFIDKVMVKTQAAIYIPLPQEAIKWMPDQKDSPDGKHIFKLPAYSTINSDVKHWAAKAGITKDVTFHVSRHTFATSILTLGGDLYTTSKLLGHQNLRTTQIYAKIIDQKKVDTVDLFDKFFSNKK